MSNLQIHVQCHDRSFEVLADEVENAELMVEDAMSQVLLELFDGGTVDEVTISFSPGLRMGLQHCSIQIHAQCLYQSFVLLPRTKENIEQAVEKSIYSILKELFVSVKVESVTFNLSSGDYENDPARSRRRFRSSW